MNYVTLTHHQKFHVPVEEVYRRKTNDLASVK